MHQLETWRSRQTILSLPPASLVIDLRADEDDMIERLKIEIADLTNEMKTQETHHWRYLSDFLAFRSLPPMGTSEIHALRVQNTNEQSNAVTTPASVGVATPDPVQTGDAFLPGLTGPIASSAQLTNSSMIFFDDDAELRGLSGNQPVDILKQETDKIIDEADRLRNNRAVAISDLDVDLAGQNMRDRAVRIIFVVDAEQPDSLASAAAYAEQMRLFRAQKQRLHQQVMLNTTVLCLNTNNNPTYSELGELLWNDRWDHIDSLIISERYRHDGVRIAGSIQTYLAELLLYVLLIVPPLPVNAPPIVTPIALPAATVPTPAATQPHALASTSTATQTQQRATEKELTFPPGTFLVGLATMEHSARWGKHLLNFKVVERSIEVLQQDCEEERERTVNITRSWLDRWRGALRTFIPDRVPNTITGISGISSAEKAVQPPNDVFTVTGFSWSLGKTTMSDLQSYLARLTSTYVLQGPARGNGKVLQDALDSVPQIEQQFKAWEGQDPEQRKEIPLANAQLEVQRLLSDRDFFTGAHGALPRAKMQIEELSSAATEMSDTLQTVDLKKRRKDLEEQGKKKIEALTTDIQSFPRLGTLSFLRGPLAWLTLLLLLGMGIVFAILVVVWVQYLLLNLSIPILDTLLLASEPVVIVIWIVLSTLIVIFIITTGRRLLDKHRSAWSLEVGLVVTLLALAIFGWIVALSSLRLLHDGAPASALMVGWILFLPTLGEVVFALVLLLVIGEVCYFFWWLRHLHEVRTRIAEALSEQHRQNISEVNGYIADSIALFLLRRTELMSEKGGPGKYHERLKLLSDHLKKLLELSAKTQTMVRRRLDLSFSETQPGARRDSQEPWLNLRIRDERLDVEALADGYTRLSERLGQEMEELRGLAEQLVRAMGQEKPERLEKEFRERLRAQHARRSSPQILMATLVATAQRLSIQDDTLASIQPLIARYKTLENDSSHQLYLMKALIDTISHRLTRMMLQPMLDNPIQTNKQDIYKLSIDAFETWGQMLWENQDQELDRALAGLGVMPKLMDMQDNAAFIKRLLALRTSLFGQSVQPGQSGDLYVLIPPSPQSNTFRQSLNLSRQHLVEFPDVERLILFYIQRYAPAPGRQVLPQPGVSAQGTTIVQDDDN